MQLFLNILLPNNCLNEPDHVAEVLAPFSNLIGTAQLHFILTELL